MTVMMIRQDKTNYTYKLIPQRYRASSVDQTYFKRNPHSWSFKVIHCCFSSNPILAYNSVVLSLKGEENELSMHSTYKMLVYTPSFQEIPATAVQT